MALSNKGDHEGPGAGGAPTPREPQYEIFECVYPDERRRASGEPEDEAVSRAFFATWGDADTFARRNGGTVHSVLVSGPEKRRMQRLRLLPNCQPSHWGKLR